MMKYVYQITVVVIIMSLLMLFSQCNREDSADVNQDKIYCEYELFYNSNVDKTYARATFRFSNEFGTKLELTAPSQVTFKGDVLTFKSALAYYEKEYAGFQSSGVFEWTDTDGNGYSNAIVVHPIGQAVGVDTIPTDSTFELFWTGDSLGQNELVKLTINSSQNGNLQVFVQDNLHSKSVLLNKTQLQLLGQGEATLWLDRYYSPGLAQKNAAGGKIRGIYRPDNIQVYLN
ncbi:MAG: hypothetical protein RQ866_00735 [Bacteroidales bacterium]|nr:hypothetical protein [Bacteroidales bacterium]